MASLKKGLVNQFVSPAQACPRKKYLAGRNFQDDQTWQSALTNNSSAQQECLTRDIAKLQIKPKENYLESPYFCLGGKKNQTYKYLEKG